MKPDVKGIRAPELPVMEWLNSDPMSRSSIQGSTFLVEFWEYTCLESLANISLLIRRRSLERLLWPMLRNSASRNEMAARAFRHRFLKCPRLRGGIGQARDTPPPMPQHMSH